MLYMVRKLSKAQLEALAAGRAKLAKMREMKKLYGGAKGLKDVTNKGSSRRNTTRAPKPGEENQAPRTASRPRARPRPKAKPSPKKMKTLKSLR